MTFDRTESVNMYSCTHTLHALIVNNLLSKSTFGHFERSSTPAVRLTSNFRTIQISNRSEVTSKVMTPHFGGNKLSSTMKNRGNAPPVCIQSQT